MQKKAIRVSTLDPEVIMEEATRCDRLKYTEGNEDKNDEVSKDSDSKSK
jgi:hypothetical protein